MPRVVSFKLHTHFAIRNLSDGYFAIRNLSHGYFAIRNLSHDTTLTKTHCAGRLGAAVPSVYLTRHGPKLETGAVHLAL